MLLLLHVLTLAVDNGIDGSGDCVDGSSDCQWADGGVRRDGGNDAATAIDDDDGVG